MTEYAVCVHGFYCYLVICYCFLAAFSKGYIICPSIEFWKMPVGGIFVSGKRGVVGDGNALVSLHDGILPAIESGATKRAGCRNMYPLEEGIFTPNPRHS